MRLLGCDAICIYIILENIHGTFETTKFRVCMKDKRSLNETIHEMNKILNEYSIHDLRTHNTHKITAMIHIRPLKILQHMLDTFNFCGLQSILTLIRLMLLPIFNGPFQLSFREDWEHECNDWPSTDMCDCVCKVAHIHRNGYCKRISFHLDEIDSVACHCIYARNP